MTEERPKGIADQMPRREMVAVGDKILAVRELTVAKRDATVKIVLSSLEAVAALLTAYMKPRKEPPGQEPGAQEPEKGEGADRATGVLAGIQGILLHVLGGDLTRLSCLCLDVAENRKLIQHEADELEVDHEHGYEFCPAMFRHVRENLTPRQELELLAALYRTNDFEDLIKKYRTLLAEGLAMAGFGKSETRTAP